MFDVMLDLEYMGKGPDAAITAIGAVAFNIETGKLGAEFYTVVDLESSMKAGGTVEASTILWWMQQSEGARAEFKQEGLPIAVALKDFSDWVADICEGYRDGVQVWGNGAASDNVILRGAYTRLGMEEPWPYYGDRCYRTIRGIMPHAELIRLGTHHNALHDAKTQAVHLIQILRPLTKAETVIAVNDSSGE